jgi:mono/diheme cytochrome c family protein
MTMSMRLSGWAWVAMAVSLSAGAPSVPSAKTYRALLDQYCVACHNERAKTAGLLLDKADLSKISEGAETWEKVARKLRGDGMPPPSLPRPDTTTRDGFVSWLETSLDRSASAHPNPGRTAVHRLNRAEYTNAIRDLLALDIDGATLLPPDDSGYGFDNNADVLSVSPMLTERYLSAARKISRVAVGDPTLHPATDTFAVNKYLKQDDRRLLRQSLLAANLRRARPRRRPVSARSSAEWDQDQRSYSRRRRRRQCPEPREGKANRTGGWLGSSLPGEGWPGRHRGHVPEESVRSGRHAPSEVRGDQLRIRRRRHYSGRHREH